MNSQLFYKIGRIKIPIFSKEKETLDSFRKL